LLATSPPKVQNAISLQEWVLWLHNQVNTRLAEEQGPRSKKRSWTMEEVHRAYPVDSTDEVLLESFDSPLELLTNTVRLPLDSQKKELVSPRRIPVRPQSSSLQTIVSAARVRARQRRPRKLAESVESVSARNMVPFGMPGTGPLVKLYQHNNRQRTLRTTLSARMAQQQQQQSVGKKCVGKGCNKMVRDPKTGIMVKKKKGCGCKGR
jgi:hypothetical protein